jgi:hypothetical protein
MAKKKERKSVKEQKLEQDRIMESRARLALMLATAASAWKTGLPFHELLAEADKQGLKSSSFFLSYADEISSMLTWVESEERKAKKKA